MAKGTVETKLKFKSDSAQAQRDVKGMTSGIKKMAVEFGLAVIALKAMNSAVAFFRESAALALATDKAYRGLAAATKRAGIEWTQAEAGLRAFTDRMQTMTGIADEEFAQAIQLYLDLGFTIKKSMQAVEAATDLAIAKQEDFVGINKFLSEAFASSTGALMKWGIQIDQTLPKADQFRIAIEEINKQVGGAADEGGLTTNVDLLGQKFGDLQESLGALTLGPLGTAIDMLNDLLTVVNSLQTPLQKVAVFFQAFMATQHIEDMVLFNAGLQIQIALLEEEAAAAEEALKTIVKWQGAPISLAGPLVGPTEEQILRQKLAFMLSIDDQEVALRNTLDVRQAWNRIYNDIVGEQGHSATDRVMAGWQDEEDAWGDHLRQMQKEANNAAKIKMRLAAALNQALLQSTAEWAAGDISMQQAVARAGVRFAVEGVAGQLEAWARLWAAKAIAFAFSNPLAAVGYAAAAAMAVGGAAIIRQNIDTSFAETDDTDFGIDEAGGDGGVAGGTVQRGRTLINQGPVTLNYSATLIINGNVIGEDDLFEKFTQWNEDQLRSAGADQTERARG